jgi:hypothetical protein
VGVLRLKFGFDIHLLLPLVALVTAVMLAVRVWRFRHTPLARNFIVLMASLAIWSLAAFMEHAALELSGKVFWIYFSYLGIAVMPVAWLVFCLRYTGHERWVRPRNVLLLSIIPAATIAIVWTNGLHHLMWQDIWLNTSIYPPIDMVSHGGWFWIHAIYSYTLILLGELSLLGMLRHTTGIYHHQLSVMLLATMIPWVANALYISGLQSFAPVA